MLLYKQIRERLLEEAERLESDVPSHAVAQELRELAENVWPTCTDDRDDDAAREAVRETQYACY